MESPWTMSPLAEQVESLVNSESCLKRQNAEQDKRIRELQQEVAILQRALEMACTDYSKHLNTNIGHLVDFYKYKAEVELSKC